MAEALTLAALMKEKERLDAAIGAALVREYPVGELVYWTHGRNEQVGRVTEHWGTTLRARNVSTGKYKDLDAWSVHYYAEQRYKPVRKNEMRGDDINSSAVKP